MISGNVQRHKGVICRWCEAVVRADKLQWHFVYQCLKCPPLQAGMRICSKCQSQLSDDSFSPAPNSAGGRRFICKKCCANATAEWRSQNQEPGQRITYERPARHAMKICTYCDQQFIAREYWPHRARCPLNPKNAGTVPMPRVVIVGDKADCKRRSTLRRYGMTESDFSALLAKQGGKCAICGATEGGVHRRSLHVDHNHETGVVRGLLCIKCNQALGQLNDDPALLLSAIDYLVRHKPLETVS